MEDTCPICKRRLEAHDDGQMAECGLELMQKDYGHSYTEDSCGCVLSATARWMITTTPCWPAAPACWCWETIPAVSLRDEPRGVLPAPI